MLHEDYRAIYFMLFIKPSILHMATPLCILIFHVGDIYSSWSANDLRSSHLRHRILVTILVYNPLAELFPLFVPGANALAFDSFPMLCKIDVSQPVGVILVFKIRPAETILSQRSLCTS